MKVRIVGALQKHRKQQQRLKDAARDARHEAFQASRAGNHPRARMLRDKVGTAPITFNSCSVHRAV